MDTYEHIIWIHMGAQAPGPGPKLAAGLNVPGSGGTLTLPPGLGQGLAPESPYVSHYVIIYVHVYSYYVSIYTHMAVSH